MLTGDMPREDVLILLAVVLLVSYLYGHSVGRKGAVKRMMRLYQQQNAAWAPTCSDRDEVDEALMAALLYNTHKARIKQKLPVD